MILLPHGAFDDVWRHFWLTQQVAESDVHGIWWVESRDAAKHPTMHGTAPMTKLPAPDGNSAKLRSPALEEAPTAFYFGPGHSKGAFKICFPSQLALCSSVFEFQSACVRCSAVSLLLCVSEIVFY